MTCALGKNDCDVKTCSDYEPMVIRAVYEGEDKGRHVYIGQTNILPKTFESADYFLSPGEWSPGMEKDNLGCLDVLRISWPSDMNPNRVRYYLWYSISEIKKRNRQHKEPSFIQDWSKLQNGLRGIRLDRIDPDGMWDDPEVSGHVQTRLLEQFHPDISERVIIHILEDIFYKYLS